MPDFLIVSIVASVVLTVLVNLGLRVLPDARRRLGDQVHRMAQRPEPDEGGTRSGVRVIVPWKLMLIGSLVLTAVVNLVVALR